MSILGMKNKKCQSKFQFDLKLNNYRYRDKCSSNDDYLPSSERSCLPFISPAFSPSSSRALINATELLKYAEKQITDICNKSYEIDSQQTFRTETSSKTDKMLQHIQHLITKKLEEIDNPGLTNETYRKSETTTTASTHINKAINDKLKSSKNKNIIRHDMSNKKLPNHCCHFSHKIKPIAPKKIHTTRAIQTDREGVKQHLEPKNKKTKLQFQTAPLVTIPPSLKFQTLKTVHISPDTSMTFDTKNTEIYNFKYKDLQNNNNNDNDDDDDDDNDELQNNNDILKDSIKDLIQTDSTPKATTCRTSVPDCSESRNIIHKKCHSSLVSTQKTKTTKVPNNNLQNSKCHDLPGVSIPSAQKKIGFNDSHLIDLSLQSIDIPDVDSIIKTNNKKLNHLSQTTSKICKALYKQVFVDHFKSFDKSSSTDKISVLPTLDETLSNIDMSSESVDKRQNIIIGTKAMVSADCHNLNTTSDSLLSLNSSDCRIPMKQPNDHSILDIQNSENDSKNAKDTSEERLSKVVIFENKQRLQISNFEKKGFKGSDTNIYEDLTDQKEGRFSNVNEDNRVERVLEMRSNGGVLIEINNLTTNEHRSKSCNIDCKVSKKNEEANEICKRTKYIKSLSTVKIDCIKHHSGQEGISKSLNTLKDELPSIKTDGKGVNTNVEVVVHSDNKLNCNEDVNDIDQLGSENQSESEKSKSNQKNELIVNEEMAFNDKNKLKPVNPVIHEESCDDFNQKERFEKYVQSFMTMNKSLTEQISHQIYEEMNEIVRKAETNFKLVRSSIVDSDDERKRSSPLAISKNKISDSEQSEGEVKNSMEYTHSLGELKSCDMIHSPNSVEISRTSELNKINSQINSSISSNSLLFSVGEI